MGRRRARVAELERQISGRIDRVKHKADLAGLVLSASGAAVSQLASAAVDRARGTSDAVAADDGTPPGGLKATTARSWTRHHHRAGSARLALPVMTVSVIPDRREIGTPTTLFHGSYVFQIPWDEGRSYDVSQDGETFLMLREPAGGQRRRIVVTLNWLTELKAKVKGEAPVRAR